MIFVEPGANAPGSIFKVKVKHQIKGSGGIFVESPDGDFFFINEGITAGDVILVQVSSYGDREKLPRVTTKLLLKVYVIVTPFNEGLNIARIFKIMKENQLKQLFRGARPYTVWYDYAIILRIR